MAMVPQNTPCLILGKNNNIEIRENACAVLEEGMGVKNKINVQILL